MAIDGFLELIRHGQPVPGETLDKTFSAKRAMSITGFTVWTLENEIEDEAPPSSVSDNSDSKWGQASLGSPKARSTEPKKCPIFFRITKEVDLASAELYLAYCKHADTQADEPFDLAKVSIRKAGGAHPLVFLVLEFGKVYVASYQVSSNPDRLPVETISFTCRSCKIQYRPQKQQGFGPAKITGWDFDMETSVDA